MANSFGETKIHNDVIATIAGLAVAEVPGIAGMSGSLVGGIAEILGKKARDKGIKVELVDNCVTIEISIVVDYGTKIPEVAGQIQKRVKDKVEKLTGNNVKAVNIIVQGVRLPGDKNKEENR
ncbi:MAG: Asp23/Gls24 family envelope stress response protein [Candidatus Aureabacteria bacterium]|nr:Asp23/Gls24 family envelope stress response protein [Candidatus Auribacterota bacterium]